MYPLIPLALIGDKLNFIDTIFEMERNSAGETIARHKEEDRNEKRTLRGKTEIDAVTYHENHEP